MKLTLDDDEFVAALEKLGIYQTRHEYPVVPKLAPQWRHWTPARIKCAVRAHARRVYSARWNDEVEFYCTEILPLFADTYTDSIYSSKCIQVGSQKLKKVIRIGSIHRHFTNAPSTVLTFGKYIVAANV